jgi:multiple sugar transport system permease protein
MAQGLRKLMLYFVLLAGAAIFTIPMLWMLSTALKPIDQAMSSPPRWLAYQLQMAVDGEDISVGVEKLPDEGVDPDTPITVQVAYRWLLEIDGEQVPVKPAGGGFDPETDVPVTVNANYHLHADTQSGRRRARIADRGDGLEDGGGVAVFVIDDEGYVSRITVDRSGLHKTYDQTIKDTQGSFAETETLTVSPTLLSKSLVSWDDRQELAHVFVEQRPATAGDLHEKIALRWGNFGKAIEAMKMFPTYLKNTLVLCVLTVIGTVCSSTLVAYGFSRIEWPGRDKVFLLVMATMMIPFPVVMVPLFTMFRDIGWIGTLKPLWVPTFFAGAFNVFLLRQFFRTIPKDLSESAKIDGCSELRIFWQIILPLARPAITVVALFQFMGTWNDFLGPLIYLTDQEDFTLALGLQFFQSKSGGTQWHYLMAASTLVVLPVIVLFFLAQKTFIEGISMSGLKG